MNDKTTDNLDLDSLFDSLKSSEPYLADTGFTDSVMAQLPARRGLAVWQKNLMIVVAALLGSGLASLAIPFKELPIGNLMQSFSSLTLSLGLLGAAGVMVFGLCGGVLWANKKELI